MGRAKRVCFFTTQGWRWAPWAHSNCVSVKFTVHTDTKTLKLKHTENVLKCLAFSLAAGRQACGDASVPVGGRKPGNDTVQAREIGETATGSPWLYWEDLLRLSSCLGGCAREYGIFFGIVACAEESVVVANAPTPIATKINRARRWVLEDYFAAPPAARKALCVDLSQFPGFAPRHVIRLQLLVVHSVVVSSQGRPSDRAFAQMDGCDPRRQGRMVVRLIFYRIDFSGS